MLTYAANFWPLFWAVLGGGAVLTVLLTLLVATVRMPGRQPALVVAEPSAEMPEHLSKAA